jgi:hypothetical protein
MYWLGSVLFILGSVGYGTSLIFYNTYLPLLVRFHPKVRSIQKSYDDSLDDDSVSETLDVRRPGVSDAEGKMRRVAFFGFVTWR